MGEIQIHSYGCTDSGQYRLVNEDYINMNDFLFVLADGMGGHNAGDIASNLAVETIMRKIDYNILKKEEFIKNNKQIERYIQEAIQKTNDTVLKESRQHVAYQGMGTTLVLAIYQPPHTIHIANIGDSRGYLYRKDRLTQLTQDHSVTAKLLRNGTITQTEAKKHPYRHHLSQSIGTSENIHPYINAIIVQEGDSLLLCSDGLWNVLSDDEIKKTLQTKKSPKITCNQLIEKAKAFDSKDNISSIIINISK